jgi:protoporphyrinogen/coproporphyrinogen III oxidase
VVAERRVVVIGGGVSGLATAYRLVRLDVAGRAPCRVTVLEAEPVAGGKIETGTLLGVRIDTGPDAVLVRSPAVAALLSELGLDPLLRAPAEGGAYLWSRGRLRPLPAGSVFGVPQRLWPLLRSGLLGPLGFLRAGADLVLPRRGLGADPTIEQLLRPRFGRQVFERLVEPMLGGVHAGRAGRLSARSAVPEVAALAERHRSLYLALRGRAPAPVPAPVPPATAPPRPRSPLMTLDGGLGVLVDTLRAAVEAVPEGTVLTGARVAEVAVGPRGEGFRVTGSGFAPLDADDVVLAVPAAEAARLLRPLAPAASVALEAIPYAGVATVVLGYRPEDVPDTLPGTGFLVPPVERRLLVGCSWLTAKWPHLTAAGDRDGGRDPDGGVLPPVLIRGMVGRDGDQAWATMDDASLVAAIRAELAEAMGVRAEPVAVLVRRIPAAMPQYTVGHAGRLAEVRRALTGLPGMHLTGAGYRGVGISGCITQAEAAAVAVRDRAPEPVVTR